MKKNDKIAEIYYNPEHPAGYGSVREIYKALGGKVSLIRIKQWLSSQDAYTSHKYVRKKFKRRKVISRGINYQVQADLVDVQNLRKYNKGNKYILTAINVFSRKAAAVPLKSKTAVEIIRGLKIVFKSLMPFQKLQTDQGKEFFNKQVSQFLQNHNIFHFFTASDLKSSIVERFNRTLKEKLWKHFTAKTTLAFVDVLPKLVKSYNNRFHRSIGMPPNEVNKKNEKKVWEYQYGDLNLKKIKFKYGINDKVKITKYKGILSKGYLPNWTNEVFIITDRLNTDPPTYKIRDDDGHVIKGIFYEPELQRVIVLENKAYPIQILKTRKNKGKIEYLVHFVGFPSSKDAWIMKSQLAK